MSGDLLDKILRDDPGEQKTREENEILHPLLDEINLIFDQGIRQFVRSLLVKAEEFWVIPASFSGKHYPPDERKEGGNVVHTQRVVRLVRILAESQERSSHEIDILTAAALLHDLLKGKTQDGKLEYDSMHPYAVDSFVNWARGEDEQFNVSGASTTTLIDDSSLAHILRLIRCHMGIWSPIPETIPLSQLEWYLHYADRIATKLHLVTDHEVNEARWNV
ncbi:MAG TPA: HD domain-containing protein [Nitrososphaera sp.]|nr:HD domain-containing protein [Nitrososphaera sp.]